MRKEPIKKSILRKAFTAAAAAMILCFPISAQATETIACIGDSLTYGFIPFTGLKDVTYPDVLEDLLGDGFEVLNLGRSGYTLTESDLCYFTCPEYEQSLEAAADMYIIMLGTNDSQLGDRWDALAFEEDLNKMVDTYRQVNPDTTIVLIAPPTLIPNIESETSSSMVSLLEGTIRDIIHKVSEEKETLYIDLFEKTTSNPEWLGEDGLHFTQEGYRAFGEYVYEYLTVSGTVNKVP